MAGMGRRAPLLVALAAVLLLSATAAGDPGTDKARIDGRIGELEAQIERAGAQAGVLTTEISAVAAEVRDLEAGVHAQEARLSVLERELAASRSRLQVLDARIEDQTRRLAVLERQYDRALTRLERRLRVIYTSDPPDTISFALGASSFSDVLDTIELIDRVGTQDKRIAATVDQAAVALARNREESRRDRIEAAAEADAVAARTSEQRAVRDRLVASRDELVAARTRKETTLAAIQSDRQGFAAEVDALRAESAALAASIAAAQAAAAAAAPQATSGTPEPVLRSSTSGFIWPVNGTVTSSFGARWGRMHEGLDIAAPSGTPVSAAASGTVIQAGWFGGYGNLVVIDHGNGVSTAYAHNSSLAVSVGQTVAQGALIASVGSTGNSTGPHVHFEVHPSGAMYSGAVDPVPWLNARGVTVGACGG